MTKMSLPTVICLRFLENAANSHHFLTLGAAAAVLSAILERYGSKAPKRFAYGRINRMVRHGFLIKEGKRQGAVLRLTDQAFKILGDLPLNNYSSKHGNGRGDGSGNTTGTPVLSQKQTPPRIKIPSMTDRLVAICRELAEMAASRDSERRKRKIFTDMIQALGTEIYEIQARLEKVEDAEEKEFLEMMKAMKEEQLEKCRAQLENIKNALVEDDQTVLEREARRLLETLPETIQRVKEIETFVEKLL